MMPSRQAVRLNGSHMFRRLFFIVMLILHNTITHVNAATTSGLYVGREILPEHWTDKIQIFATFPSLSLNRCARECDSRSACSYIYYVRRWSMCYVLKESDSNLEPSARLHYLKGQSAGSVFGVKAEWQAGDSPPIQTVSTECGPHPNVPDTVRMGNMYQTGSKAMYRCEQKYHPTGLLPVFTTCRTGGQWDPVSIRCYPKGKIGRCNVTGEIWIKDNSCYILTPAPKLNHVEATDKCTEWGSHLVTISSQEEQSFIESMLDHYISTQRFNNGEDVDWAYIGFTDDNEDAIYKWTDGTPATFKNWATGDGTRNNEHCAVLGPDYSYKWADVDCDRVFRALCEIEFET